MHQKQRRLLRAGLTGVLAAGVLGMLCPSAAVLADEGGTTYYVSSSTGSDSNSGTSEDQAWKSFANLAELELTDGDKVLLKSGDSWLEQLRLNSVKGTEENPVVLSSYGEGEKPKLARYEGEVPALAADPVVYVVSPAGFEIRGLDIGFSGVGIDLFYDNSYNNEYVRIEDCHFHDIYGFYQLDNVPGYPHATSIVVTRRVSVPGTADPSLIGLYIHNCTTNDAGSLITYGTYPINEGIGTAIRNMYITDCLMENNAFYGTVLADVDGGYMDNCIIRNNGSRPMPAGSMGVMISCKNFTVMNCEISGQQRLDDNPDGGGIDFEHMSDNVSIVNCYIHDNSGVGIMFYNSGGTEANKNTNCRVIDCVFENNNQNIGNVGGAEIVSIPVYSLTNGEISHNRYLESRYTFSMWMDATVEMEDNASYATAEECPYPLLNPDDVRKAVIAGGEVPSGDSGSPIGDAVDQLANGNTAAKSAMYYGIGAAIGAVIAAAGLAVVLVVTRKKKPAKSAKEG